jgi:hypothetical protein
MHHESRELERFETPLLSPQHIIISNIMNIIHIVFKY